MSKGVAGQVQCQRSITAGRTKTLTVWGLQKKLRLEKSPTAHHFVVSEDAHGEGSMVRKIDKASTEDTRYLGSNCKILGETQDSVVVARRADRSNTSPQL